MDYAAILVFMLVSLTALAWDLWIPSSGVSRRRPGAYGTALSLACSSAALVAVLASAPRALIAALLAFSLISCTAPLVKVVSFWRIERARTKHESNTPAQQDRTLPTSLTDADQALKTRYDELARRFEATAGQRIDPSLIEQGRHLTEELSHAARFLGSSRAYEMSKDIPALTYWAADMARYSYPAGDERRQRHEQSLRYYESFEATSWLWHHYQRAAR